MTLLNSSNPREKTPLQNFYAGHCIFITGGTGFLGKILVEKLLRCCTDVSTIYILIRTKKNQDARQRLKTLLNDSVFDRLKKEVPDFRQKVLSIPGDTTLPGLGISESDRQIIKDKVSIVFNVAANVKFEEKLEDAVAVNVSSAKEMLELCTTIKNLQVVIHVSTLYSNCTQKEIQEKIYQPPLTGNDALKLVQILDSKRLNSITKNLLGNFPNTYTYTKCIAEELVQLYGKQYNLPVGIFRPAIVSSALREPDCGWVDNLNGATGILAGVAAGMVRIFHGDENCLAEVVPVDLTVNALLSTAWDVANLQPCSRDKDLPIYNYHSNWTNGITYKEYVKLIHRHATELPSSTSLWYPTVAVIKSLHMYYFLFFLSHIIPAIIMDTGLYLSGKKPKILQMYKKIHRSIMTVTFFVTADWIVKNDNVRGIWKKLTPEDQKIFFFSMENFDWDNYVKNSFCGYRRYLFKEDLNSLTMARKRMSRIFIAHCLVKFMLYLICFWILYHFIRFVSFIISL